MNIFHSRTQHSVGQGGFHSAIVDDGTRAIRYIYDCGSTNSTRLAAAIADYRTSASSVELLFLSHLDQDHVNGIDRLLEAIPVETVVLPYLTPFERILLAAEAAATAAGLTGLKTHSELLLNPAGWLLDRGAGRVVFVRGTPGGDPVVINPGDGPREPSARVELPARELDPSEHPDERRRSMRARSRHVLAMAPGPIYLRGRLRAYWALVPYVHPEPELAPTFVAAVAKAIGRRTAPSIHDGAWLGALKKLVANRTGRARLARLYRKHLRRDHNLSSMYLYSGPVAKGGRVTNWIRGEYLISHPPPFPISATLSDAQIGWMGTGDAHLDVAVRRQEFDKFYASILSTVGTLVLPHHGSKHNLTTAFFLNHLNRTWVAPYGMNNQHGHPDRHLMRVASSCGVAVRVTERGKTEFTEAGSIEW